MAYIIKKIKNRRPYYYIAQSARIDGKPRIIWQKYLGTIDEILKRATEGSASNTKVVDIFEAGGVAAMLRIIERIQLIEIIDKIVPKRSQGPTIGEYIAVAIINRVLAPCSKLQMPEWYKGTILCRLWRYPPESFSSQHFWDHMDLISEDKIEEIQKEIALQIKKEFTIDPTLLMYDTTNFFTYIATNNIRNTTAQRGRQKQKRHDLRQVGLALLVSKDFQIPLFHKVYQGSSADQGLFPQIVGEIKKYCNNIFNSKDDTTLVFDKGNISQAAMDRMIISEQHFVCAVPKNTVMSADQVQVDLFSTPIDKLRSITDLAGTRALSRKLTIWDKQLKVVVAYSESYFASELTDLSERLQKCQKKLHDFALSLLDIDVKKKSKGLLKRLQGSAEKISCEECCKELFDISVVKERARIHLNYHINQAKFNERLKTRLGRTLIVTSRQHWSLSKIISAYRGQSIIEEAFRRIKAHEYLRWQPTFHWTDQKIKVHGLYCVFALLVASLTHKIVTESGVQISLPEMLEQLTSIREVIIFDSDNADKRHRGQLGISRMSPSQKKLAEITGVPVILARLGSTKSIHTN